MGIPGILKEIGKGERVALAKLAIEHLEQSKRPLRLAIDAAIWNFQTQAGQGGKNPALRTLFYRLVKLLALPIDPVFVYDGKNKPLTKRGKTVSKYGTCISNEMSKRLVQAFRFPSHTAPGEAEAECAMLQKHGLVDAVMSQDVDAIMFGSSLTLRDWSKEASKHNKSPTHVNVLDLARIKSLSGLDPDGMILVALLSGGDYDEAGVPGIGSTLACEIARAGFGTDLVELARKNDQDGLREWRERLEFELETNESGYFKRRKNVKLPENFPDRRILGYYINPAVTPEDQLPALESRWMKAWDSDIDIEALRTYVGETFDWLYKPGAWKLVRVMAPALLADGLRRGVANSHIHSVEQITERRKHFVSDGIPELRVTVIPAEVVGLDLDAEEDSPEYLDRLAAEEHGGVDEVGIAGDDDITPSSPSKKRKSPPWLPHAPEKMWIAETIVNIGAREHADKWRQIQAEPKKFATRKSRKQTEAQKQKNTGGMQAGALLGYVVASKPSDREKSVLASETSGSLSPSRRTRMGHDSQPLTPTKPRPIQLDNVDSPAIKHFFKPSKARYAVDGAEEALKQTVPVTATKFDSNSMSSLRTPPILKAASREDPFLITSSPVNETGTTTEGLSTENADLQSEQIPDTVTRRKKRGHGKRDAKVFDHEGPSSEEPASPTTSPVRPKRTIESFFAPYIAASQQQSPSRQVVPKGVTKELVRDGSDLAREEIEKPLGRHLRAIPRPSLPGTWREAPDDVNRNSPGRLTRAAPRVSIVDLTEC
ncbi:hypothetical protein ABEF93_004968 [Exophiala dermatitidis]